MDLKPGADTLIQVPGGPAREVQLQLFPNQQAGFNNVVSILIGLEPSSAVGQMLIGLL
ncbi:MAG TPA: hypothetical protein VIM18_12795 [Solirubrobacteraceae bacterium]